MREYLYNLATDRADGVFAAAAKLPLLVLSWIYGLVVRILVFFSRINPYQAPCKVISVGNITLGGTGKTVVVEYLARFLKSQGRKVAILSRGYKRKVTLHASRFTSHEQMGDEPYMLLQKLKDVPVIVDADRKRAIEKAVKDYAVDAVILDDGFQQWGIKKDLEIVCVDAVCAFGNRKLLPRGILREPLTALKRADAVLLTKCNLNSDTGGLKDFLKEIKPGLEIFEAAHRPVGFYPLGEPEKLTSPDSLKEKNAALFSGIAGPVSFEQLIKGLEINVGLSFIFPDHYHYTQGDLDRIFSETRANKIDTIITTEKDAARLGDVRCADYHVRLLVLAIELSLKDEQRFRDRILGAYSL
jgi:tetraacyldisaccharide 4'-kinase